MRRLAVVAVLLVAGLFGCAGSTGPPLRPSASPGSSVPPVVRQVLAAGEAAIAPGQNLELVRYTIAPGTQLPSHRHPGLQLAYIESGTLTYTVVEGTVVVHQVDGGTRSIGPGETATIATGEWLAEHDGVVHFGQNGESTPLVILASSLLDAAQPPAVAVSPAPS